MNFETYLQEKKYRSATVDRYSGYAARFIHWLGAENLRAETFTYTDLLAFIAELDRKAVSKQTQMLILCAIRHYTNYLQSLQQRADNPAAGLQLKGRIRKLPQGLLSVEELEELYLCYSVQLHVPLAKKVALGLLVFQGLTVGELLRVSRAHLRLQEGKMIVVASRAHTPRTLPLQGCQVALLGRYLRACKQSDHLFFIQLKKENVYQQLAHLFAGLRVMNPKVSNAKQLRSSVIANWLKSYPLREVQYRAGHKYVSSTERYQLNSLDELQDAIAQYHPMSLTNGIE